MKLFFVLAYSTLFASGCAAAMVWITERRDRTYRLGEKTFSDCLLCGASWFASTLCLNLVLLAKAPRYAPGCDALLLALMAAYMAYKEKSYRRQASVGEGRGQSA